MLGAIGIVLGVLALVIPLFGALGSCVPFVDAACNDACTPCTDEEKKVSCHLFCGDLWERIGVKAFRKSTGKPKTWWSKFAEAFVTEGSRYGCSM